MTEWKEKKQKLKANEKKLVNEWMNKKEKGEEEREIYIVEYAHAHVCILTHIRDK